MEPDPKLDELLYDLNWAIEHCEQEPDGEHKQAIFRLLREHPELARMPNGLGAYPLHNAAYYDCGPALLTLLAMGAEVDVVSENRFRQTPLHLAAQQGNPWACENLAKAGADLMRRAANGFTPLMEAIYPQKDAAVGALLRLGAPMDLRVAVCLRQTTVVRLLLRDNPGLIRIEPDATDLVTEAAFFGGLDVLRLVLEAGADPNTARVQMHSLCSAMFRADPEAVRLLLAHGADPDREIELGGTARRYAEDLRVSWALELFDNPPPRVR